MREAIVSDRPSTITVPENRPGAHFSARVDEGGLELVHQLGPYWRDLCDDTADDIFYRPEWTLAYLNAFAPEARLTVISVWANGRMRGIMPLVRERIWASGLPAIRLTLPSNVHCFRTGPAICGGEERDAVIGVLWNSVKALPDWGMLDVSQVVDGSGIDRISAIARSEGFQVARKRTSQTLFLPVGSPENGQPWAPEIRPKFRSHLRRTRRQLEEQGKLELKHFSSADPAALQRFYDLEGSGWKGVQGTAIRCHPSTLMFYDSVAQAAAQQGYLSLDFLELSGKPIAAQLGFNFRGHYYLAKAGYDENYRRQGPGQLLVNEVLSQSAARGLRTFDFVGPATWDESRWASERHNNYRVFIFRRNFYGGLLHVVRIASRDTLLRLVGRDDDESKPLELKSKPHGSDKDSGTES
jgi:ribosomal protein S18 acetylase RimI-like enzyme